MTPLSSCRTARWRWASTRLRGRPHRPAGIDARGARPSRRPSMGRSTPPSPALSSRRCGRGSEAIRRPAPLRPRRVLDAPQVRIYADDWGQPGDVGVVGELEGRAIGACWLRLLPPGIGLASVDGHTPQLGIAILPEFQGKGFGRELLTAALRAANEQGYRQVSLTVHPQNPAIGLYERCGFEKRSLRNAYHLMVATLP